MKQISQLNLARLELSWVLLSETLAECSELPDWFHACHHLAALRGEAKVFQAGPDALAAARRRLLEPAPSSHEWHGADREMCRAVGPELLAGIQQLLAPLQVPPPAHAGRQLRDQSLDVRATSAQPSMPAAAGQTRKEIA